MSGFDGVQSLKNLAAINDVTSGAFGLYKTIRDEINNRNDNEQFANIVTGLQKDPNQPISLDGFSNKSAAFEVLQKVKPYQQQLQQDQATSILAPYMERYNEITGGNPRFATDENMREIRKMYPDFVEPQSNNNPFVRKTLSDFKEKAIDADALSTLYGDERARIVLSPTMGKDADRHNLFTTAAADFERGQTRADKAEENARKAQLTQNDVGFNSAVAGLTAPSLSPTDAQRLKGRYGLAPFSEVASDIQQAGGVYGASPEAINKAIDNARTEYLNTPMGPTRQSIQNANGATKVSTIQDFALGAPRIETQLSAKAPSIRISTGGEGKKKAMPQAVAKDLIGTATQLDSAERFVNNFKDDYGGYGSKFVGDTTQWVKRNMPGGDKSGSAQYWQDYQTYVNQVRNDLFGAALTVQEKGEFEKAMVNPGMSAAEIKKNLARQKQLTETALSRKARGNAILYGEDTVREFTGREIPDRKENPTGGKRPPLSSFNK